MESAFVSSSEDEVENDDGLSDVETISDATHTPDVTQPGPSSAAPEPEAKVPTQPPITLVRMENGRRCGQTSLSVPVFECLQEQLQINVERNLRWSDPTILDREDIRSIEKLNESQFEKYILMKGSEAFYGAGAVIKRNSLSRARQKFVAKLSGRSIEATVFNSQLSQLDRTDNIFHRRSADAAVHRIIANNRERAAKLDTKKRKLSEKINQLMNRGEDPEVPDSSSEDEDNDFVKRQMGPSSVTAIVNLSIPSTNLSDVIRDAKQEISYATRYKRIQANKPKEAIEYAMEYFIGEMLQEDSASCITLASDIQLSFTRWKYLSDTSIHYAIQIAEALRRPEYLYEQLKKRGLNTTRTGHPANRLKFVGVGLLPENELKIVPKAHYAVQQQPMVSPRLTKARAPTTSTTTTTVSSVPNCSSSPNKRPASLPVPVVVSDSSSEDEE